MSEQNSRDPYIEHLSDALYKTSSPAYLQYAIDEQPRQSIIDTQAALRKPTNEKLTNSALFWSDLAVLTAENALQATEALDSNNIFNAYSQAVGTVSMIIDSIKKKTIGTHTSTGNSNILIARMLDITALSAVIKHGQLLSADKTIHDSVQIIAPSLMNDERQSVAWKGVKIGYFWGKVSNYQGLEAIGSSLRRGPESIEEAELLGRDNDALFSATEVMLQYGVKPAIAPSRIVSKNIREWLVQSRQAIESLYITETGVNSQHEASRRRHDQPWIATFISTDQRFKTSKLDRVEIPSPIHSNLHVAGIDTGTLIEIVDTDKNSADTVIKLGRDGHLYSNDSIPLIYALPTSLYEVLRADILSIYADLVVPIYVVDLYEQERKSLHPAASSHKDEGYGLRNLVLSRQRVLHELSADIICQLEDESVKAERSMAEHDVIGHVRRLPSTYRASQEAREFCRADLGYELADFGETYVRDHKRGNKIVETLGHRAELKHVASAAIKAAVSTGVSRNTSRKKLKRRR
jgi:hypothetical protein